AATVFHGKVRHHMPEVTQQIVDFIKRHPQLHAAIASPFREGVGGRHLLALLDEKRLSRVLSKMLDESEFLSEFGIRSMSRYHLEHPYIFRSEGEQFKVSYLAAESDNAMFGGNSNWRGPIWMPLNLLLIRALLNLYQYYGDDFKIECPTGSGRMMTLFDVG